MLLITDELRKSRISKILKKYDKGSCQEIDSWSLTWLAPED